MVAIVTGAGTGLERSSASLLGARGQVGSSNTGRAGDNVFVNAATGNLVISRQDEFLVGVGPDIAISRTYNSQSTVGDGDNGDNWRASVYRQIIGANGAATVTRVDWDGSETIYTQNGANSYICKDGAGAYDLLSWTGSQWVWTDGNSRVTDTYDANGRLLNSRDTDLNSLTYAYVGTLLSSVTDQNGERTDFIYGGTGGAQLLQITTVAGASSVRVRYGYDSLNRLQTVTVDLSQADSSIADGKTYITTYGYDGTSKRVASISQSDGSLLQIGYTANGAEYRVTQLTQTVASGVTRVTGLFYDTIAKTTRITDALGGVTTMAYDDKGNLLELTMPIPTPTGTAPKTVYTYNANGDLLSMTENGRRTDYEYDPATGNLTLSRDAAGNTVTRTYGSKNELLTETQYRAPDPDGAGSNAATFPVVTRYAYDAENHLRFSVRPEGEVIEYRYSAAGQVTSTIAYTVDKYTGATSTEADLVTWVNAIDKSNSRRTDTVYDFRGNVSTVTRYSVVSSTGAGVTTSDYSRDTYVYTQYGELQSRINNASAASELFYYDGLGRLYSTTSMANATTTIAFNEPNSTTTATITGGLTRVSLYNKAGELVSVTESGANVVTAVTSYGYDALGRLRMETNAAGNATYYVYDNASRKVADITADGAMTEYAYEAGRLVKTTGYVNKLTSTQITQLGGASPGGAGGAGAGAQGISGGQTGSNLLSNASFETPGAGATSTGTGWSSTTLPSWTKINSQNYEQVVTTTGGVNATDGSYWLDLDSVAGAGWVTVAGERLVNGSFETAASDHDMTGWVKVNPEGYQRLPSGTGGIAATNGTYWLDLDSTRQTGTVTVGGNFINNGSFETAGATDQSMPGWVKLNAQPFQQMVTGTGGVAATNGTYWLDLDSKYQTGWAGTGANWLVNGSFEQMGSSDQQLPGWIKSNPEPFQQLPSGTNGVAATDGNLWLDLDSQMQTGWSPVGANLVWNSSFEAVSGIYGTTSNGRWGVDFPSWTSNNNALLEQVTSGAYGVTASNGTYWLDLDASTRVAVGNNLLTNGSFEEVTGSTSALAGGRSAGTIPGWTKTNTGAFEMMNSGTGGVTASDGSYWLDLDIAGPANLVLKQTVTGLAAGQILQLSFDHANRAPSGSGSFDVWWNNQLLATYNDTTMTMQTTSMYVTAVAGDNVLQFRGRGTADDIGASLDNVRLLATQAGAPVNVDITQKISNLTAGLTYRLQFDYANRTTAASGSFDVLWDGAVIASVTNGTATMQTMTIMGAVGGGDHLLTFRGTGTADDVGASIDNVRITWMVPSFTPGNMNISQAVPGLTAGQKMELSFDHANRTSSTSGSFDVLWNDQVIDSISSTGTAMLHKTYYVTAAGGNDVLRFRGTGSADDFGASIDNVRLLTAQPVYSTGNMDVSQTVSNLTAGQSMQLTFDYANRTTAASGSFDVLWNGAVIASVTNGTATMQTMTITGTVAGGDGLLTFRGTGTADDVGASIDNVQLYATQPVMTHGNMDIRQTVNSLTAGKMQLQFDHANRTTAASGSFDVYWNGNKIASINSTGTTMLTETYQVDSVVGNNTLRFVGTGTADDTGASIDNVRLLDMVYDTGGGNMDISQSVTVGTAGPMQLMFDHANRTTAASGSFDVYWNGNPIASISSTGTTMLTKTFQVAAVAGTNTVRFVGTGTVDALGASIDNVRLFATQSGGSGGITQPDALAGLRPGTHNDDRYQWNIYDSADRIVETIDAAGAVITYSYDGVSSLIATTSYANNLTTTQMTAVKTTTPTSYVLPTPDSAKDRVDRNFYDKDGLLIGTIDAEGWLSQNLYDENDLLIETIRYASPTNVGDRAAGTFATLLATVTATTNPNDIHNWFVYDGRGLLRGTIDGEGDLTRYRYTAAGDVDQQVRGQKLDPSALMVTRPTFASLPTAAGGQVIETIEYSRNGIGQPLTETRYLAGGATSVTSYAYDSNGRMTSLTASFGASDARTLTQRYDARGNLIGELAGEGSAALAALGGSPAPSAVDTVYATWGTIYTYDGADRLIAKKEANGLNALGNRTLYYYTANDQLAFEVNAAGEATEFRYNSRGERTDTIVYGTWIAAGTLAGLTGGVVTTAVQSMFTGLANAAADNQSHLDYNVTGTVKQSIDPLSNLVTYDYNAFRQVRSRTDPLDATTSVQTDFAYDRRGMLVSEKVDAPAGGLQLETVSAYDAFGRLYQVTDAASRVRKTDYDRAGRVWVTTDAQNRTQTFFYDGRGNVLTLTDRNNVVTTFTYDAFNRTTTSTTPGLITTTIKTNAHGDTVSIKDGALRETVYNYDRDGNLKSEIDAATNQIQHNYDAAGRRKDTIDARNVKTSYEYDAVNRVLTEKVDDGGLALTTRYEYDAKGQRFKITDPANRITLVEFDKNGRQTAVTVDSAGKALRTEYAYDKGGRLFRVIEGAGTAIARTTENEYDKAGRLFRTRIDPTVLNLTTTYLYDKAGNVSRMTDASLAVTTYAYDAENRLTRTLDGENGVAETFYDFEGRVVGTRRYATPGSVSTGVGGAFVISATADSARDEVTGYVYDADGRMRYSVDGVARPTEFLYDGAGNLTRSIAYAETIAFAVGDSFATVQSRVAALAALPDNRLSRASYDSANRQTYTIDATGAVTAFLYDGSGNVTREIRYFNLFTAGVTADQSNSAMQTWAVNNAHAEDRVTRTFYDGASRATFLVDAENFITQYQYDLADRLTKQIRHASNLYSTVDGTTEAGLAAQIGAPSVSAAVTTFGYDTAGRLVDTTDPALSVTHLVLDALGQATDTTIAYGTADATTTHRVFDRAGRVDSESRAWGTGSVATTVYTYDGMGRTRTIRDPLLFVSEIFYDKNGRVITEKKPVNATTTAITQKEYDKFGNLSRVIDPLGNSGYFYYDALDRLTLQVDPEGYATKTDYKFGNEPASVTRYATAVTGASTTFKPTPATSGSDATTIFTRDKLNRLKAVTDAENKTEYYDLNAFGDRISVTNRLTGVTVNTFDKRGLLKTETLPVGSTNALGTVVTPNIVNKFEYDGRGNRTKVIEGALLPEQRTTNFEYDNADRLKKKYGDQVTVYATLNPAAGVATVPTENYTYNARDELIETWTSWGARTLCYYDVLGRKTTEVKATAAGTGTLTTWGYDLNGNATSARIYSSAVTLPVSPGGTPPTSGSAFRETLYTFDASNRLTHSKVTGLTSGEFGASYSYGQSDIIVETVYDLAGNIVQEKDGRNYSTYHFYDKAGRRIAKVDRETYLTFYTLDAEGNVKTEERFATPVGDVTVASIPANLKAAVAGGAGNRITQFEYDKNGRRKSETRLGVQGMVLDVNGDLAADLVNGPNAQIRYDYNGLGQVTRKTEANGDFTDFEYDFMGRQTAVQSALYTDFQNASVRRRTESSYNALGDVTRSMDKSKTGVAANDRVTTYTYALGGRLDQTKDAEGFTRTYRYDAAGNVVMETYARGNSFNSPTNEGNAYRYDLLNRITAQSSITESASGWSEGVVTKLRYNTFGEITGRGLNANAAGTAFQETFDYDGAGRMWRSTSGDGSVRIYAHDRAGNANLVIASAGDDLSALTLDGALAAYAGGGIGVATTGTKFDKRGQATGTVQLQRQIASGAATTPLNTSRFLNAFGEVWREIDARDAVTDYAYNTSGKLIQRELPIADYTTANAVVVHNTRPTEKYSYDSSGRLIGVEDANGNVTTRRLLAGTGYGDGEAIVVAEYHPDDGIALKGIDEFGNVRTSTDEITRVTSFTYDKMGRLTQLNHAGGLIDYYGYDGLGQRTQQSNNYYAGVIDRTDYDAQGRVTRLIRASGTTDQATVETAYAWSDTLVTTGLGTFGGWTKTTTNLDRTNNRQATETTDYFGRMIGKTDYSLRTYAFTYDKAGRIIQQTSSANQNLTFTYFNTGKAETVTDGYLNSVYSPSSVKSTYAYDKAGNRTFEGYVKTSYVYDYYSGYTTPVTQTLQAASVSYDDLGRMKTFNDNGATGSNPASVIWDYDRVGNIRRVQATSTPVGLPTWMNSDPVSTDRWYTYDTMNRMAMVAALEADGQLYVDLGTINSGLAEYDKAGQRTSFTYNFFQYEGPGAGWGKLREDYTYTAAGYLQDVKQTRAYYTDDYLMTQLGPWGTPVTLGTNTRDLLGRLTAHTEYADGVAVYSRGAGYDMLSQMTFENTTTKQYDGSTLNSSSQIHYRLETSPGNGVWTGEYQGGVVTHVVTNSSRNFTTLPVAHTRNTYSWWDDAQLLNVTSATGTTSYTYDENGKLASVYIQDGRPRQVLYTNDLNGQVMSRIEYSPAADNPKEIYYYFNGLRIGDLGNTGFGQLDYVNVIGQRGAAPQTGPFNNEYGIPSPYADFDQAFSPISPNSEPNSGAGYTVREGDTLRTVAQMVWGDADMWYLIGEANGLSASSTLTAGQVLKIPAKVTNIHNNTQTFRVYDPNKAIGDNSPSQAAQPKPAKKGGGCGVFGIILLVVIAVVVTALTYGALTAPAVAATTTAAGTVTAASAGGILAGGGFLNAVAAGAIASAAGSIVSQAVGVATGIQDKFSWKAVAIAGLSGGISGGIGGGNLLPGVKSAFLQGAARGVVANVATQGVAVATGLQSKFDWTSVAVSAAVSGTMAGIRASLPAVPKYSLASYGQQLLTGAASAAGGAATRSIIKGTNFGDNLLATLPDVIGQTIGNMIVDKIGGMIDGRPAPAQPPNPGAGAAPAPMSQAELNYRAANRHYSLATGRFSSVQMQGGESYSPTQQTSEPVDGGDIIVTGTRMSPLEKARYDLSLFYEQNLVRAGNLNRALAEYNPISIVTRLAATGADRLGFTRAGTVLRNTAEFSSGVSRGLGKVIIGTVDGTVHLVTQPGPTLRSMTLGAAGYVDIALNSTPRGVYDSVSSGVSRLRAGLASGDPRFYGSLGEGTGELIGTVATLLAPVPKGLGLARAAEIGNSIRTVIGEARVAVGAETRLAAGTSGTMAAVTTTARADQLARAAAAAAPAVRSTAAIRRIEATTSVRSVETMVDTANTGARTQPVVARVTPSQPPITPAGAPRAPVAELEVASYGNAAARSVKDGMTPDHIPSLAAVRQHVERQLDRKLLPDELRQLKNITTTVTVDTKLHQQVSRTYGGRNTPAQIAADAGDLRAAVELDVMRYRDHFLKRGFTPDEIDAMLRKLHQTNEGLGLY